MSVDKVPSPKSFTGREGKHTSRWSVKMADRVSSVVITVGGIATIASVLGVFVVLFSVVVPLFFRGELTNASSATLTWGDRQPLGVKVDEYRVLGWSLFPDGSVEAFRIDTGEVVFEQDIVAGEVTITAASLPHTSTSIALALSDGTVQLGSIAFKTDFLPDDAIPEELQKLKHGDVGTVDGGVVQVTPQDQFRTQKLSIDLSTPL